MTDSKLDPNLHKCITRELEKRKEIKEIGDYCKPPVTKEDVNKAVQWIEKYTEHANEALKIHFEMVKMEIYHLRSVVGFADSLLKKMFNEISVRDELEQFKQENRKLIKRATEYESHLRELKSHVYGYKNKEKALNVVKIILEDIHDRRGYRQIWDGIDSDIRKVIVDTLQEKVKKYLDDVNLKDKI